MLLFLLQNVFLKWWVPWLLLLMKAWISRFTTIVHVVHIALSPLYDKILCTVQNISLINYCKTHVLNKRNSFYSFVPLTCKILIPSLTLSVCYPEMLVDLNHMQKLYTVFSKDILFSNGKPVKGGEFCNALAAVDLVIFLNTGKLWFLQDSRCFKDPLSNIKSFAACS